MSNQLQQTTLRPNHPPIAVAVNENGGHVGIVYCNSDTPKLLHLGNHRVLLLWDNVPQSYAWIECAGLDADEGRDFASWLSNIHRHNANRIPYGINFLPGPHFDSSGNFTQSHQGFGLTCATFVMSIFEAYSYVIVDVPTWEHRNDDNAFFDRVVEMLNAADAPPEHIQAQIAAMGTAVRFRPLEVAAAAAIYTDLPVTFKQAVPVAERFGEDLQANANAARNEPLHLQLVAA